jgi:hypothetical protein
LEILGNWREGMEHSWKREECVVLCVILNGNMVKGFDIFVISLFY